MPIEQTGQKLRNLFSQAPAAIALLEGPEHIYTFANPLYLKIFSLSEEEVIGKPLQQFFPENKYQGIYKLICGAYNSGQPFMTNEFSATFQENGTTKTGFYNFTVQPVKESSGNVSGLIVHAYEVTKQVETHKKLEESETKYRAVFETMHQGFCLIDVVFNEQDEPVDYIFLETNPVFESQTGLRNVLGKSAQELVPHLEDFWFRTYGKVARTGEPAKFVESSKVMGRWFEVNAFRIGGNESRKVAILFTDITDRRKNEEELKRNKDLLQTVFDASPNSITVFEPVYNKEKKIEDFRWLMLNNFTVQTTGRTDLAGKKYAEEFPHVKPSGIFDEFKNVMVTGKQAEFERWYEGDGLKHWFRFVAIKIDDLLVVTTEDITKRRNAEENLRISEKRFRAAVEAVQGFLWTNTSDGKMKGEQPGWTALTGQTFEEYQDYGWANVVHPDDAQPTVDAWNDAVLNGKTFEFEHKLRLKNGEYGRFSVRAIPLFDNDGDLKEWVGVHTNITELKKAEEALRYRSALLEAQNEAIPDAILIVDTKGKILSYNKHFASIWKIPQNIIDDKDDIAALQFAMTQVANPQEFIDGVNYCYAHPDEKAQEEIIFRNGRIIERYGNAVTGDNGTTYGWIWFFRDITERKKAEGKLRESEERFRSIANDTPAFIFIGDAHVNVEFVNKQWLNFVGLLPGEGIGKAWERVTHPADIEPMSKTYSNAVKNQTPYEFEIRQKGTDGLYHWVLWKGIPRINSDGHFIGMIGIGLDISDRKQAEEAVKRARDEAEKQRRLYETVTNSTPDLIFVFDTKYRFTYANKALLTILSKTWNEAEGKGLLENGYEPWHAQMHEKEIDEVVATKKQIRGEVWFPHATLGKRVYDYIFAPVINKVGEVEAIAGTARDITDIKLAEASIRKSESQFRILAESLPQLIWMSDDKGNVEYSSKAWIEYTGIEDGRIAFNESIHPDDKEPVSKLWTAHLLSGEPFRYELRLRNKNGNYKWHYSVAEPVKDENANTIKWIGALADINDQKTYAQKLEQDVADRTIALQQSNNDLQQFAHVASHDLKEPVRKIKTFAGRLENELKNENSQRASTFLQKINGAADRMFIMIEGVLTYSQLSGQKIRREKVNLHELIQNIQTDLEVTINEKSASVKTKALPIVEGSPVLLYQLFYNLIVNSLKFSKEGVEPVIDIDANVSEDWAEIIISDNGIGFEQNNSEQIFDTFSRLHSKDKYEGTGLGLSLCRKIVERHGGTIKATGQLGKGAKFIITIPLMSKMSDREP